MVLSFYEFVYVVGQHFLELAARAFGYDDLLQ